MYFYLTSHTNSLPGMFKNITVEDRTMTFSEDNAGEYS